MCNLQEESTESERTSKEPVKAPAVDIDILAKPIKPTDQATRGKEPDKTELGVGEIESSLPTTSTSALITGNKKQTMSVSKRRVSGSYHGENNPPKLVIKSSVNSSNKGQQGKVASRSPEQVVTVRPQYGRLIPELSPMSQRLTTAGTVRAVFTVAGTAASPHLKATDKTSTQNLSQAVPKIEVSQAGNSNGAKTVVLTTSTTSITSTGTKPVFANVYERRASTRRTAKTTSTALNIPKTKPVVTGNNNSAGDMGKATTSITNSLPHTTSMILHPEGSPISTSLSKLPAGNSLSYA